MKIKDAENQLDQADSFLTKLEKLLKKHWLILLIMLLGYGVYWIFTIESFDEAIVVDQYYEHQDNGDSLLIEVWSDGTETVAE